MVIEKTKVRIKETGDVKDVEQIRLDKEDIVILIGGKKYIYPFEKFNYIPCLGVIKDVNNYDIFHRDFINFTGDGAPQSGIIYWNQNVPCWQVYNNTGSMFFPWEISNIEVIGNDMNANWQSWR